MLKLLAKAADSDRFLATVRNFDCPPSESVLEADEGGASAVRFRLLWKHFSRPSSESVLEADRGSASAWEKIFSVRRPNPSASEES